MNRILHRRTAYALRLLLEEEGLSRQDAAHAFIHMVMEAASSASGAPVSLWAECAVQPPLPSCVSLSKAAEGLLLLREIPQEDWRRHPELAGWMYQYMLEERKEALFAGFKKGNKAGQEDIPAVTQLFTPEWIARYMAENAVGRLWTDRRPDSALVQTWRYFDRDAAVGLTALPRPGVWGAAGEQMAWPIGEPIEWRVLDPACGCGHLLTAAFDVLLDIYEEAGFAREEAVRCILTRNLFGLDIDPLAVRICRFILLLKGAAAAPSILGERLPLGVEAFDDASGGRFGSLDRPQPQASKAGSDYENPHGSSAASLLARRYDAVITNPPYLGRRNMDEGLAYFLDKEYPRSRNDLFAAFLERSLELLQSGGYHAAINQHSWMFLSGYEALRERLLHTSVIVSLLHLGTRAFDEIAGEVVQSVCFIVKNTGPCPPRTGVYWKLTEEGAPSAKERAYLERRREYRYLAEQGDFLRLPGKRIAYELPAGRLRLFRELPPLSSLCAVKKGMDTGCNERYVRYWHEVPKEAFSHYSREPGQAEWFPYAKGGGSRRWYGNHYYVVLWAKEGEAVRKDPRSNLRNAAYYGRPGVTWSTVSTGRPGFRLLEPGFLFDNGGSCVFPLEEGAVDLYGLLAFLNSRFTEELLRQLNPTLNVQPGDVSRIPVDERLLAHPEIIRLGKACVELARTDWDHSERSWNYAGHPAASVREGGLEAGFALWRDGRNRRFMELDRLEREIDGLVYSHFQVKPLQQPAEAPLKLPSVMEDISSLMSYAAGCMMDRYSIGAMRPFACLSAVLHEDEWLPRLRLWLGANWGEQAVDDGIRFLGQMLGLRKNERPEERIARYFREEWYKEHRRDFDGKPLYLRFSSGKTGGFTAYVPAERMCQASVEELLGLAGQKLARMRQSAELSNKPVPSQEISKRRESVHRRVLELEAYIRTLEQFVSDRQTLQEQASGSEPDFISEACSRLVVDRYGPVLAMED